MMEEECFPGNESSADVWLVRGNVFIQLHEYELDRKAKDAKYVTRWPDAIVTANESFYKAIELKQDVKPAPKLLDARDGQLLSAPPIHNLAVKAMNKQDYTEAIRLLNMVIRSYKVDPKTYALYLSYAYLDLADCYKAIGDEVNYKKILLDAAKLNVAFPDIYLNLYDIYKKENDTVKCGEILNQARKAIPDSLAIDVKGYELDYFAMIGDTLKLKNAAIKMFEQYKDNPVVINIIAGRLLDNKEYELAEEMLEAGLAIAPDDFDLNQQMTYRFFYEALDYNNIMEEKKQLRKFTEATAALNKANEILGSAVIWAEKAYNINKDDVQHNKMYNLILLRLEMPVPEDLQEKVNSYYKPKN
jgi:tetratricopeptide (TPR) repeat protein